MHPGDESDPPIEVRVTDRRRFTETGDARDEEEAAPPPPTREPAPSQLREPAPSEETPHPGPDPHAALELGVEAVFFIFYQSALIALGAPEVVGEAREPDLGEARQAIEFLRVLEAKTVGNLTTEEWTTLRQLLDDAQMRYVHAARGV